MFHINVQTQKQYMVKHVRARALHVSPRHVLARTVNMYGYACKWIWTWIKWCKICVRNWVAMQHNMPTVLLRGRIEWWIPGCTRVVVCGVDQFHWGGAFQTLYASTLLELHLWGTKGRILSCAVRYGSVRYGMYWTVCTIVTVRTVCTYAQYVCMYVGIFTYVRMHVCT